MKLLLALSLKEGAYVDCIFIADQKKSIFKWFLKFLVVAADSYRDFDSADFFKFSFATELTLLKLSWNWLLSLLMPPPCSALAKAASANTAFNQIITAYGGPSFCLQPPSKFFDCCNMIDAFQDVQL